MTLEEAWRASDYRNKCDRDRYKLCKFEPYAEDERVIAEACINCGNKVYYNKVGGRIDNQKYLVDHIRDTVQPHGITRNLFIEIYGYEPIRKVEEMKKIKEKGNISVDDRIAEGRDVYKTFKKLADSGKELT